LAGAASRGTETGAAVEDVVAAVVDVEEPELVGGVAVFFFPPVRTVTTTTITTITIAAPVPPKKMR
jgi:hypothetical protein